MAGSRRARFIYMKIHGLLQKLLHRRGIGSADELDQDERTKWDEWHAVLSKETLSVGDIEQFCSAQVDVIERKWLDLEIKADKKAELVPYHTVYKSFLRILKGPQIAREAIERQLEDLLKQ